MNVHSSSRMFMQPLCVEEYVVRHSVRSNVSECSHRLSSFNAELGFILHRMTVRMNVEITRRICLPLA